MNLKRKLIFAGAFLVVLLVIVLALLVISPGHQKSRALSSLEMYLNDLDMSSIKSTCNKDSDGDGYASCSYNNGQRIVNLECDSAFIFNTESCKTPKNMYNN